MFFEMNLRLNLLAFFVCVLSSLFCQKYCFSVRDENNDWKLVTETGEEYYKFPFEVDYIYPSESNFLVIRDREGHKYYFDVRAKALSSRITGFASAMSDGMAKVRTSPTEPLGYRDFSLKIVIPHQFKRGKNFHNGVAWVKHETGGWFLIDKKGNRLTSAEYEKVDEFVDDVAQVKSDKGFGYVHISGKEIAPPIFQELKEFHGNVACVNLDGAWGVIDKSGKVLIKCQYFDFHYFFEKGISAYYENKKFGMINSEGLKVIPPIYDRIKSTELHGYGFGFKSGKWYFLNPNGKELSVGVDRWYDYHGGFFRVYLDGKWGYLNRTGRIALLPRYDVLTGFHDGLAQVKVGDKWGYIDSLFREVIPPQFSHCHLFQGGYAGFVGPGTVRWGFIDRAGNVVIEPQFTSVQPFAFYKEHLIEVGHNIGKMTELSTQARIDNNLFEVQVSVVNRGIGVTIINRKGEELVTKVSEIFEIAEGVWKYRQVRTKEWGIVDIRDDKSVSHGYRFINTGHVKL